MRRRRVLALLSASLVGLAGCSGNGGSGGDTPTPEEKTGTTAHRTTDRTSAGPTTTRHRTATDATDRTATTTATTDTPRPTPDGSADFPPPWDPERVVWSRDGPVDGVSLDVEIASSTLPGARAEFTLANRGEHDLKSNFWDWGIHRWEDGRWYYVAPLGQPMPQNILHPGDSQTWGFTFSSEIPPDVVCRNCGEGLRIQPVGGGTYAFEIPGWVDYGESSSPMTLWAARFHLDGPDLPLEPSRLVEGTTREGRTVEVNATVDDPEEDDRLATYVLSRAPEATDPRPMITEQVYNYWPLRDALCFVGPDVDEVRVRAYTGSIPAFGVTEEYAKVVEYGGGVWRESVENEERTD